MKPEREDWMDADEAFNAAMDEEETDWAELVVDEVLKEKWGEGWMDECDGTCPDGRYCREHGDLLPEDEERAELDSWWDGLDEMSDLELAMWGAGVVPVPYDEDDDPALD